MIADTRSEPKNTPAQRQQMRDLVSVVNTKLTAKEVGGPRQVGVPKGAHRSR